MLHKIKPDTNHDLIQEQDLEQKLIDDNSIEIFSEILANIIVQKLLEHENK